MCRSTEGVTLEFIFELLFEVFGEFILQVLWEAFAQAGVHLFRKPTDATAPTNPWLLGLGYALMGALAGGLSLLVMFDPLLRSHGLRVAYVLAAPIAAGALIAAIARWRTRKTGLQWNIDRFANGYLFALAFALVRFYAPR